MSKFFRKQRRNQNPPPDPMEKFYSRQPRRVLSVLLGGIIHGYQPGMQDFHNVFIDWKAINEEAKRQAAREAKNKKHKFVGQEGGYPAQY